MHPPLLEDIARPKETRESSARLDSASTDGAREHLHLVPTASPGMITRLQGRVLRSRLENHTVGGCRLLSACETIG